MCGNSSNIDNSIREFESTIFELDAIHSNTAIILSFRQGISDLLQIILDRVLDSLPIESSFYNMTKSMVNLVFNLSKLNWQNIFSNKSSPNKFTSFQWDKCTANIYYCFRNFTSNRVFSHPILCYLEAVK